MKRNPCDRNVTPVSPTNTINLSTQNNLPVFLVRGSDILLLRSYIRSAALLYLATRLIGYNLNILYI